MHAWLEPIKARPWLGLTLSACAGILIGLALLLATSAVYIFGRNRIRTSSDGFSSVSEPG